MSYERLMREHAQIETMAKRLIELVSVGTPEVDGVVLALSALSRELTAHLAHEDSFIYPRMIEGNNATMRDAANAFTEEFASLRADWLAYLSEWSSECIAADWDNFRQETLSILDRLQRRVDAENNILYATALRQGAVSLRESYAA